MSISIRRAIPVSIFTAIFALTVRGAEPPKVPVPKSPYMSFVYRYADTMLERGRDTIGPQKTGLFLSALDRTAFTPRSDANVQHDQNLLRLLYTLSELTTKPVYRDAADGELKWFLENSAHHEKTISAWDKRFGWDALKDESSGAGASADGPLEFFRPWMLWDRCFDVAPEAAKKAALELAASHGSPDSPRQAGFLIRTWAVGFARTKDEQFLKAIELLLRKFDTTRGSKAGAFSRLSLAIDCDGAAHRAPESLAPRLRAFAEREDIAFCGSAKLPAALWSASGSGEMTTAQAAMMCVSRYENTGRIAYRDLIHAAADQYADTLPDEDVRAGTLGHVISLQLAAWRSTGREVYLNRARALGDAALAKFFAQSPLPRASLKADHYDTLNGGDTLVFALLELHLHVLHITAVRQPPNTIDR